MPSSSSSRWFSRRGTARSTVDRGRTDRTVRNRGSRSAAALRRPSSASLRSASRNSPRRRRGAITRRAVVSAREALAIEARLNAQGAGAKRLSRRARAFRQHAGPARRRPHCGAATALRGRRGPCQAGRNQARYQAESSRERAEAEQRASSLSEQLTGREDRVSRSELRAPMDGIVNSGADQHPRRVAKAGRPSSSWCQPKIRC